MINLGDEVKDTITGLKGIAIARHTYLQGCDRISVQQPVNKSGEVPEAMTFDEPQLKIVTFAKIKRTAPKKNPGGPEKYRDRGRLDG